MKPTIDTANAAPRNVKMIANPRRAICQSLEGLEWMRVVEPLSIEYKPR